MAREGNGGLIWVAAAGLLAGAGAAWVVSQAGAEQHVIPAAPVALPVALLVGWSFIGSGLLSWRPGDRLGPVLVFTGFGWFAGMLPDAHDPVLFTIGEVFQIVYYVGFVYLILSFPAGRLYGALDRALLAVTIGLVTVGQLDWLLFADSRALICRRCPANLVEIVREDSLVRGLAQVQRVAALAVTLAGIGLLVVRWRRASRPQRHAVMPVAVAGAAAFATVIAWMVASVLGAASAAVLGRAAGGGSA